MQRASVELEDNYPRAEAYPVLAELRKLVAGLNYSSYKKSIAIFVSPSVSKVYYLDVQLQEHVSINKPFNMRQLIDNKRQANEYLVLVLSGEYMKVFAGGPLGLKNILSSANNIEVFENDAPQRVSNFSDPSARKEALLDKFLHYADHVAGNLLKCYPYPLFVMAPKRVAGHFKDLTANTRDIVGYVHGNFDDSPADVLQQRLAPGISKWNEVKQLHLLNRLDHALSAGKLAVGMHAVYKEASCKNGQLLVIERNCTSPLRALGDRPFYIKDAIDGIIEKVLENGGDVEFVDEGVLMSYRKIALIKYY